jgi:hypothetical protein
MLVWVLVLLWILESLTASSVVVPKPSLHFDQLADILSPGVRVSAGSATGSVMDADNVQSTTCGILMRKGLLSMSLLQNMDFWHATRYFPHVARCPHKPPKACNNSRTHIDNKGAQEER